MAYTVALFIHILSALGFVAGLGIVYVCLLGIRRAPTVQALRLWTGVATRVTRTVVPISGAGVVVAGLYLYVVAWRGNGNWALVSLAAFFLVGLVTGAFQGRWIAMLGVQAQAEPGEALVSGPLAASACHPRLLLTANGALGLVAGVLFLMVAKPGLAASLIALACALVVGLSLGVLLSWRLAPSRTQASQPTPA